MNGQILLWDGSAVPASTEAITAALAKGDPFWLDFDDLDDDAVTALRDQFKVHPLALEDVQKFGQRPKFETYDNYVHLVMYGANDGDVRETATPEGVKVPGAASLTEVVKGGDDDTIEVHAFYCEQFLVTVHRHELAVFDQVRTHAAVVRQHGQGVPVFLLYRVVDALVDGFFPVLDRFDDTIDSLEDEILKNPTDEQLGVLFDMKRRLVRYRKIVTPERDVFAGIASGALELPGMTDEAERYFRDIYDHLIRISDLVDSYRDLMTGAVDTHLSVVSNRLNVVMKQLAIIATVFLPLSFLTGFFGQNFSLLVNHFLAPAWTFWALGIGTEVVAVALLFTLFKRRQWL